MNNMDLKNKIMKLWKDTFHDSDSYISLIFDNYFNPEFIEYQEEKNQVISALMGIPYEFGNGQTSFKGIYLCGLATKEEFRHRGIMTELINRINKKAKDKNYIISFLIPASDMLRIYYQSKGYVNGIYRVEERYTDIHDFDKDYHSIINNEDDRIHNYRLKYFENMSVKKFDINDENCLSNITKYINKKEQENYSWTTLQHSSKDIEIIIKENSISGGEVLYAHDEDNEIKGVIFITFDDRKRMNIPKVYYDDQSALYRLLGKAKQAHIESPMSIWRFPEEINRQAIWGKIYGAANPDGGMLGGAYGVAERVYDVNLHSQPYGMVKILNIYEILKFLAEDRKDAKFSILIKDDSNPKSGCLFNVENGKIRSEDGVEVDKLTPGTTTTRNITVLGIRDLSEILFRKKDSNNLIMEAFGIPRISMNMALMLD